MCLSAIVVDVDVVVVAGDRSDVRSAQLLSWLMQLFIV